MSETGAAGLNDIVNFDISNGGPAGGRWQNWLVFIYTYFYLYSYRIDIKT